MSRWPDENDAGHGYVPGGFGVSISQTHSGTSQSRGEQALPSPTSSPTSYSPTRGPPEPGRHTSPALSLPSITTYWGGPDRDAYSSNHTGLQQQQQHDEPGSPESPIDPAALQFALPPNIFQSGPPLSENEFSRPSAEAFEAASVMSMPYSDDNRHHDAASDSDRAPLATSAGAISGALNLPPPSSPSRTSFQMAETPEVPSSTRNSNMLGFDLERGGSFRGRHQSFGNSLTPDGISRRSRSGSTSGALHRTASIMRAMSQRVVDISGGGEALEQQALRDRSRSPSVDARLSQQPQASSPMLADFSYPSQVFPTPQQEKKSFDFSAAEELHVLEHRPPMPNPLRGKSLGVFSADNPIRLWFCDLLMQPWVETLILVLIIFQVVLLAVEAAPDVWSPGNGRPEYWGQSRFAWPMLGLFVVFTLEIIMRVIVSGFIFNAPEYSTIDRQKGMRHGVRAAVTDQYRAFFQPQRQRSVKRPAADVPGPSSFARSFTLMHGQPLPGNYEEQQRMQLARRAFLRHSFNRLDFVAVVSFWISFVLSITGIESASHIYVFRMLSCLRIIRLLSITKGNSIILRSLKKAAPLLVRVSFLIGFFWLLFAIIGVQSFKSSLSRQCVWLDPMQPDNLSASYTNDMGFCGGHLENNTESSPTILPWVYMTQDGDLSTLVNGTRNGKGFICPRGSICLQQTSPYNNTVSFDNIAQSLELVFVIMSANTFSDLMYYTTNSDYLAAALFFAAGIMIMMLWMTNLLIAVITSSFQLIREENKGSAFTADEKDFVDSPDIDIPQKQSTLQRVYQRSAWVWVLAIALDLLAQAFHSAAHEDREPLIHTCEIVVTVFLDIEMVIRIAIDWRRFHQSYKNLVDLALAVITTVILLPPIYNRPQLYAWLTVFQIIRAYRVVLVIPITRSLIKLVLGNATGIANLVLFVFLITFFVAIFAVQLFRGEITHVDDGGEDIRITFATIFNSFLGMYQILSSENWTAVLYTVTGFSTNLHTAWVGAIFLIGWFILAYFILVNMFIAVIQENFDVSEDQKRLEQVKAYLQRKELGSSASNLSLSAMFSLGRRTKRKDPLDFGPATMEMLLKEAVVREFLNEAMDPNQEAPSTNAIPIGASRSDVTGSDPARSGFSGMIWSKVSDFLYGRDPNPFYSNARFEPRSETMDPRQMARQAVTASSARRRAQREYLSRHPAYNNSLYIFTPRNPIRRLCQRLVGPGRGSERFDGVEPNKYAWYIFSAFIYASIVAMVVIACVTTPLYQKQYFDSGHTFSFKNWFVWTDAAFALVFSFEAMVKIIADGFFWTPNAYFRSSWGVIDAVVLITLWINVATLFANDGAVSRAVGAFKALRALRLLNVSDSARETFHSLMIIGGWKILSAAFVSISLLIPFAIYGVNLFRGQMVTCNDSGSSILRLADCTGEYLNAPFSSDWEILSPRVAENPFYSFDDFGSALLILFTIVSQEGWVDVSFQAQSVTGAGNQPRFGSSVGNALFFVVFNLLATVFILTLFISVFMRNYTEQTGVAFLTGDQRAWLELRKLLRQISPSKTSYDDSKNKLKMWCHKRAIEKRGKWHMGITMVLVLHLILLVTEYSAEPNWWTDTRDYIFLVLTFVYMANITIRILGLGWSRFRRSSWDIFSLCAVAGAFVTSILFLAIPGQDTLIQLHKIFLVAIVLLLIPRNDALDQLFKTAAASVKTIGSLLATWAIFFLVFAIAMTQSFSLTRFGAQETNHINFRTVANALILLLRMSCGEGWNQVMEDFASIEPPLCVEASTFFGSDCGSTAWARVLFIAWNIISMYIFVNLFVSLIYESFSYVYQRSSGLADISRDEIRRFKEAWRSVDPDGTGYISREDFPRLLGELSGVFEMRIYDHEDSVGSILEHARTDSGPQTRHASLVSQTALSGVNLQKLNERVAQIDIKRVRERRRRFNIFYEEVMVSADPDKGIFFTTVLMILAHYNIISDSKSLRLEEFLRRRARLQRVDDEVRRRVVLGFFKTLYLSKKFRQHMDLKKSSRMTAVPQLDIPDILVDDEDGLTHSHSGPSGEPAQSPAMYLSADDAATTGQHHRSWSGASMDISMHDTSYAHPLSLSRTGGPGSPVGPSSLQPQGYGPSLYSFELQDSGDNALGAGSRRGSAVEEGLVREMLDDSVWVESIRRSATQRRSRRAP